MIVDARINIGGRGQTGKRTCHGQNHSHGIVLRLYAVYSCFKSCNDASPMSPSGALSVEQGCFWAVVCMWILNEVLGVKLILEGGHAASQGPRMSLEASPATRQLGCYHPPNKPISVAIIGGREAINKSPCLRQSLAQCANPASKSRTSRLRYRGRV